MANLKTSIHERIRHSRFYPHIYYFANPFKIYEFYEMIRGVRFSKSDLVLDVGCGAGLQTSLFAKRGGKAIGIDVDPKPVARAKSDYELVKDRIQCEFRCTTLEKAGFAGATFDKVFSVCVIEHIPDYLGALRECHRVLKPGGDMVFTADSLATIDDEKLKEEHSRNHFVLHYFNAKDLRRDLESVGFKDVKIYSIFRSDFARRLFMRGIREQFQFRIREAIALSYVLWITDLFTPRGHPGIFLLAKCRK